MVAQAEKSASTVQNCKASATWVGTYNRVLGRQYGRFPSNHLRLPLARWAGHSGAAHSSRQSTTTARYRLCHSRGVYKQKRLFLGESGADVTSAGAAVRSFPVNPPAVTTRQVGWALEGRSQPSPTDNDGALRALPQQGCV